MSDNIFLAKPIKIYYLIAKKFRFTHRLYSSLFIISILITFQSVAFADEKINTAEEYRVRGYEEQEKGNFDKAFQYYTKSLSLIPDNEVIYNDIGILYEQLGFPPKAEEYYLKAIRINEEYLPPYTNLAYLYLKQGNTSKAIEYFEKRIDLSDPGDPWAVKAKEEVFAIDPERQQQLIQQEAEDLEAQLIEEARKEFALQIARAEGHYQSGLKLMRKRKHKEALKEFDRALLLTPENPKIQRAREEAMEFKTKEEIRKRSQQALKLLEEGDPNSAEEEYRKILTILPKESDQKSN